MPPQQAYSLLDFFDQSFDFCTHNDLFFPIFSSFMFVEMIVFHAFGKFEVICQKAFYQLAILLQYSRREFLSKTEDQ